MPIIKVNTIADMEKLYYGKEGSEFISKTDAPVLSSTTGVYNAVYGALTWAQLNQEANAFGLLPKYPWNRSGWRVITTRAASSGGGVAENGALPDTVKPTYAEVSTKPKEIAHTFSNSEIQDFLARESMDDAYGAVEQLRADIALHHREMMNIMLLTDCSAEAAGASADRADADKYNLESLDRIVSSDAEEDVFGGTYNAWFDIYDKDRDAAATGFDAYVNDADGTDRALTTTLLNTMFYQCKTYGGNTTVVLTGLDTYAKIQGIYDSYMRLSPLQEARYRFGVNGIETAEGVEAGLNIASINGIPLVTSKDTPTDTVSRMYFLDTSDPEGSGYPRLGIMIAKPTQYFEAGINSGTPFATDTLGNEGMFRTMGEVICRFFVGQGKLRDLK